MNNLSRNIVPLALQFLLASIAGAQQDAAPAASTGQEIARVEVVSAKDPDWKLYSTMLLGVDAFAAHRKMAPGAQLKFRLQPQTTAHTLDSISLKIVNGDKVLPVPVEPDGTFTLVRDPAFDVPSAHIEINRKKNAFRWRPHIHSEGVQAGFRRLGDLRLECELRWAIEKSSFSFIKRNMVELLGGPCKTSKVRTYYFADRALASAVIKQDDRVGKLDTSGGRSSYVPPIFAPSWSDDALIEFQYASGAEASKQSK